MAADDLTAPLGQETKRGRSFSAAITASMPQAIAIALAAFLGAFVLWVVIADNPFGGEPRAAESGPGRYDGPPDGAVSIPVPPGLSAPPAPGMGENPVNGANTRTVTIIDGKTGARQEVVNPKGGGSNPSYTAIFSTG